MGAHARYACTVKCPLLVSNRTLKESGAGCASSAGLGLSRDAERVCELLHAAASNSGAAAARSVVTFMIAFRAWTVAAKTAVGAGPR